jgi:hypothetical protein
MHTKRFFVAALVVAGLAGPLMGALTVGDGSELFLTGTVGFQYDDNVFLRTNSVKSDYITTFTPGLQLVYGQNSLTKGAFTFSEAFARYDKETSQNSELASVAFNANYDDGKTKGSFNASFNQVAQNSVDARAFGFLVRRDLTDVMGRGEWSMSEKTSFAAGAAYDRTDYKVAGFVTSDMYTLPVDFYYKMMPKVDLSADYRYRETTLAHNLPKYTDNFLGVGARGEFTEKLSGEYHFGYTQRDLGARGNESLFGVDAKFTYLFSPKTTAQLGVSNDFSNAATGASQKVLSFTGSVRTEFEEGFSGSVAVSYRDLDYATGERDHYWEGTVGVQKQVNKYLSFQAGYTYRNNSSNLPVDFTDNVFSISGSVRY